MQCKRLIALAGAILVAGGACTNFEDPAIVIDLRMLGAIAEPPELLVSLDAEPEDLLALPPVEVCALVADPADSRELSFAMVACPLSDNGLCDDAAPARVDLGSGTVGDPEEAGEPVRICANLGPSPALFEVIQASVSLDALQGFGAIDIQVDIAVFPVGEPDRAEHAAKKLRFGAPVPEERVANANPSLESIVASRDSNGIRGQDFELPRGRCGDVEAPLVAPGEQLGLLPVEPEGAREDYVVPTFDGDVRAFTENINYQFYATFGSWARHRTGGDRDFAGNEATLDTKWRAPKNEDLIGDGLDVDLYVIQRDERGGQSWFQSCVRVVP